MNIKKILQILLSLVIITLILIVIVIITKKDYINNVDTGQIPTQSHKHTYIDGLYSTYTPYLNNDGYFDMLKITVKDGVIIKADYNLYDKDYNKYIPQNDDEQNSEEYDEYLKTQADILKLNSLLFQEQTYSTMHTELSTPRQKNYYALLVGAISAAKNGAVESKIVSLNQNYHESSDINEDGKTAYMELNFYGSELIYLDFYVLDENGINLFVSNEFKQSLLADGNTMSYEEYLHYIRTLSLDAKTSPHAVFDSITEEFNFLLETILAKRINIGAIDNL